jgi:hypothetical protein
MTWTASAPQVLKMRTARAVPTPWLCYMSGAKPSDCPMTPAFALRAHRPMTDALATTRDGGPSAGISAKLGPNVKQNDPRMPPNPYVGYYGILWLNGFESELRRHVAFTPGAGGFHDIEERLRLR